MPMIRILAIAFALAACGSTTYHTITLVNRTDRAIEQVFVSPVGAAARGASQGAMAPGATLAVKAAAGNVEVTAVSAKLRVDDKTNERRTASQVVELRHPVQLIFHDSNQTPPGLGASDTIG